MCEKMVIKIKNVLKKLHSFGIKDIGVIIVRNESCEKFLEKYTLPLRPSFENEYLTLLNKERTFDEKWELLRIQK